MDAVLIQREIDTCERDNSLTLEQKNIRKYIYSIAMQQANRDKLYQNQVEKYKKLGKQLEQLTKQQFKIDSDIVTTEGMVCKYLLNSEVGNYLKKNEIKNCTLEKLIEYAKEIHLTNKDFNPKTIKLIVDFYKTLEKIGTIEEETINVVAMGLSELIDDNIGTNVMVKDYKKFVLVNSEKAKIKSVENDINTFKENRYKALQTIKKFETQLGNVAFNYAQEMINAVFEYYENGNKKIEIL